MPTENGIDLVKEWLKDFARAGMDKIYVEKDTGRQDDGEWEFKVHLYTAAYYYVITAIDRQGPSSYLGCIVHCRYPLLGEHWRRGNDLADGPLVKGTWERIKNDIISYELVDSAPKQTSFTATFENLMLTLKGTLNAIKQASSSSVGVSSSSMLGTRPTPNVNKAPSHMPPKVKENAIDLLQSILELVPMRMLPEIIVSEDDCLSSAAAQCAEQRT